MLSMHQQQHGQECAVTNLLGVLVKIRIGNCYILDMLCYDRDVCEL